MNKGQISLVIHWLKEVQNGTIDIDAANELEFVIRYLEEMEGKKGDF